jgi:hypothetical protein
MDGQLISADGGVDMMAHYDELLNRFEYDEENTVIPAVGRKIYVISVEAKQISEEEVYALGKDSFLLKGFREYKENFGEMLYSQYYSRWFFDFNEAAAHLNKYLTDEETLEEEGFNGVWNAVRL